MARKIATCRIVGRASTPILATALIALVSAFAASSQIPEELVSAVVRIDTHINPDGRTVQGLGREREGSGILGPRRKSQPARR